MTNPFKKTKYTLKNHYGNCFSIIKYTTYFWIFKKKKHVIFGHVVPGEDYYTIINSQTDKKYENLKYKENANLDFIYHDIVNKVLNK